MQLHILVRVLLSVVIGLRMAVLYRALRATSPPREPLSYRKTALTYRIVRGRHGSIEGVHVGVEVPDGVRFRLQPESRFDRRAKQLGLATEWQVNDAEFDNNIFVVSDDPIFLAALNNDRELRKHSFALMKAFGGATVRCSAGCLWVETQPGLGAQPQGDPELIAVRVVNRALKLLLAIKDRLQAITSTAWSPDRDRSARAELVLYVLLEVLGFAGIVAFFFSGGRGENRQLLYTNTSLWTIGITLAIVAVGIPAFVALMRKSSRTHLLLFEIAVLGIPGVAGLVFAGTCWVNRHEETMPAVRQIVEIQDRYITTGRRGRKKHHLVVGWPDPRVDKEFRISAAVYHQYDTTRCARVTWHHGYLNDPFLSGMQPVPCEAPLAVE
jgi:hypothetical protein